jgi:hypothetical protein
MSFSPSLSSAPHVVYRPAAENPKGCALPDFKITAHGTEESADHLDAVSGESASTLMDDKEGEKSAEKR